MLAATAIAIIWKGQSYDPATYTGDAEALESTRQAVAGKAATLRAEVDMRSFEAAAAGEAPKTGQAIPPLVDGLVPMGPTETYNADTLFEKINGRAPAYFEYNFQELNSRSFSIPGTSAGYLDVYLFEMDSPLNAFGIFSAERDKGGQPLDFVMDGYRSEMGYFMRVGGTYAQILASSTDEAIMEPAGEFTRALAGFLERDDSGLEGRALLPEEGRVPGSLSFINENAYGQAVLGNVFEARYAFNDTPLTYFAQVSDPATAAANWETLLDFYGRYGSVAESYERAGARVFVADMFGQWSVILEKDKALSGVMDSPSRETAIDFIHTQLESSGTGEEPPDPYAY